MNFIIRGYKRQASVQKRIKIKLGPNPILFYKWSVSVSGFVASQIGNDRTWICNHIIRPTAIVSLSRSDLVLLLFFVSNFDGRAKFCWQWSPIMRERLNSNGDGYIWGLYLFLFLCLYLYLYFIADNWSFFFLISSRWLYLRHSQHSGSQATRGLGARKKIFGH